MSRTRRVFEFDGEVQKKPEPEKPIEVPKVEKPAPKGRELTPLEAQEIINEAVLNGVFAKSLKPGQCRNCSGGGVVPGGGAVKSGTITCPFCGGTGLAPVTKTELRFPSSMAPVVKMKIQFLYDNLPTKFLRPIQQWVEELGSGLPASERKSGELVYDMMRADGIEFRIAKVPGFNSAKWVLAGSKGVFAQKVVKLAL